MNNLVLRTITGVVFLAVMVAGILLDPLVCFLLFCFIQIQALRVFYAMSLSDGLKFQQKTAVLTALAWRVLVFLFKVKGLDSAWFALCIVPLVLIPVSCIFHSDHSNLGSLGYVYAGLLYIALPISLVPFLVIDGSVFDGTLLLSIFIVIWISDVGAYCLGTAFGQKPDSKKLAPSISPKKSWWGFWGGVILGTATAVGLHFLHWFDFNILHSIAVGLIISVGTVCGDLVESLWKRYFHVKDSGNIIPGHGGMLDRFDSSLVAIPLASAYLAIFGLI